MRRKLLSFALALTMCLGLTVPALASNQNISRVEFAKLLVQYGNPDRSRVAEIPNDCGKLSQEEQEVVALVVGNNWMEEYPRRGFCPDTLCTYHNAASLIAHIIDPDMEFSTAPKKPETGNAEDMKQFLQMDEEWTEQMVNFFHSSPWFCTYVEILYNKGVIAADEISEWDAPLDRATSERWLSKAFPSAKPIEPERPVESEKPVTQTANPTNDKLEVNGAAQNPTVYKIGGSNYFKIRDVAAVLNGTEKQFAVGYAGGKVTVTSGQAYEATGKELAGPPAAAKEAASSNDTIVINGVETDVTVYKIGGSNYFKLRDLGKALNFYVGWEAGRGIYIETGKPYSE